VGVPTIGLFITDIVKSWTMPEWAGVVDSARDRGVNLITFVGHQLNSPYGFEVHANIAYRLADKQSLDGIIIWTTGLANFATTSEIEALFERFSPLPRVSVEEAVTGVPSVLNDDFGAMRATIKHLIEVHGCKRIAYVLHATPRHNSFEERFRAYRETLAHYDIRFDPALVSPPLNSEAPPLAGNLTQWMASGGAANWDAIVGHNDEAAVRALHELTQIGIRVPQDVAVVGYDDTDSARAMTPSLTSVHPPFREMGRMAVDLLLEQISGRAVPDTRLLRGELILRRTCGCQYPEVESSESVPRIRPLSRRALSTAVIRKQVTDRTAADDENGKLQILKVFFECVQDGQSVPFLEVLESALAVSIRANRPPQEYLAWLNIVRRETVPMLTGRRLWRAEDLFHQGSALIEGTIRRGEALRALRSSQNDAALKEAEANLASTFSVPDLMDQLAVVLPRIEVDGCFLSMYQGNPEPTTSEPPEHSALMLALNGGKRVPLSPAGLQFPSKQLIPAELWPKEVPLSLVLEPLHFRDNQIGFILFDVGAHGGTTYESLRTVISSALRGALLVEREKSHIRMLTDGEKERSRLQSLLSQSQKLQAIGQLAAGVAHEFNNILAAIMGYSTVLMSELGKQETAIAHIEHILTAARRAADLAQRMLIFGGKQLSNQSVVDFNAVVLRSVDGLKAILGESSRLTVEPWKEAVPVLIDEAQLHQVLENLAANARDAMPDAGVVNIRIAIEDEGPERAHLIFTDTGTGMDEATQARLFEPFFSTRDVGKGIGLGLAVVWGIISQHRGTVSVRSQLNAGTTIDIQLPLAGADRQSPVIASATENVLQHARIVVASRSVLTISQVRTALEGTACSVVGAESSTELLERTLHDNPPADVVLLDITMPDIGAWEVVQQIQSREQRTRIIYLCDYAPDRFEVASPDIEDSQLLFCPFTNRQLIEKLGAVLYR